MDTDPAVSNFIASLDLGDGTPEATPAEPPDAAAAPAGEVYLLASDDILAHLRYLPEAFCFVPRGDGQRLDYVLKVDGIEHGSFLISFLPVGPAEHVVQVAPLDDVPADMRPTEIACTFTATPVALLTLLAGGAADLRADSLPKMQQFLHCFRFTSYTSFCESRGLTPYTPGGESSQAAAIAQARRVAGKVAEAAGTALSKGLHSVARATVAASDHARAKIAEARAAGEARAHGASPSHGATAAPEPPGVAGGDGAGTRGRTFGLNLGFFRPRAHSDADPFPAADVTAGAVGTRSDAARAPPGISDAPPSGIGSSGAPAALDSTRKWLQGAPGAAAGWLSSAANQAMCAVEAAKASAGGALAPSPPDSSHVHGSARTGGTDFSFLLPRSAALPTGDPSGAGGAGSKAGSAQAAGDALVGDALVGDALVGDAL
eukprot:scaffold10_cov116-Isochrysis_galbana.AAC.1